VFDPAHFHAGQAVGQAYYQRLVDRLFPEERQGTVHCYELCVHPPVMLCHVCLAATSRCVLVCLPRRFIVF